MTPNDVQIDVLMRRYARSAGGASSTEHLDADELNAFAEGSLPPSARTRYVSHIADCDSCRQLVSQLAISAGALNRTELVTAQAGARVSWTQRLAALFAPRTLRYAAFAMVLIAAVGVIFLVTRRPARNSALVAQNEKADPQTAPALQPPDINTFNDRSPKAEANRAGTTSAPAPNPTVAREADDSKVTSSTAPATRPDTSLPAAPPGLAAKSGNTAGAEQRPSYAPPPPGETQASGPRVRQQQSPDSRQQQTFGGIASGPRKGDAPEDKNKAMEKQAPQIAAKDSGTDESNRGLSNQAPQVNRSIVREKRSGPSRNMDNIATTNENRIEPPKSVAKKETRDAAASESEEAPQTRSVGGRKFRRQGASWIDVKFKSSMSLITVTRGSQEFSSLDSGLRSIASQLSGEVIVVWKSKAYRIH
ncbi:MAG: hypothetical protein AABM67_15495 [Acidobacteriota bacterium]